MDENNSYKIIKKLTYKNLEFEQWLNRFYITMHDLKLDLLENCKHLKDDEYYKFNDEYKNYLIANASCLGLGNVSWVENNTIKTESYPEIINNYNTFKELFLKISQYEDEILQVFLEYCADAKTGFFHNHDLMIEEIKVGLNHYKSTIIIGLKSVLCIAILKLGAMQQKKR